MRKTNFKSDKCACVIALRTAVTMGKDQERPPEITSIKSHWTSMIKISCEARPPPHWADCWISIWTAKISISRPVIWEGTLLLIIHGGFVFVNAPFLGLHPDTACNTVSWHIYSGKHDCVSFDIPRRWQCKMSCGHRGPVRCWCRSQKQTILTEPLMYFSILCKDCFVWFNM